MLRSKARPTRVRAAILTRFIAATGPVGTQPLVASPGSTSPSTDVAIGSEPSATPVFPEPMDQPESPTFHLPPPEPPASTDPTVTPLPPPAATSPGASAQPDGPVSFDATTQGAKGYIQ